MKFIKLLIAAIVLPAIMYAQQQAKESSAVLRTIEVIGAASTSLPPNIVNVNFVIKEYTDNAENVSIDASEAKAIRVLKEIDVPAANLSIINIYGYTGFSMGEIGGRYEERRMYALRFRDVREVALFKERMNSLALESFNIVSAEHDDMSSHLFELKQRAIKSGKEKADFLLKSLGEECGRILHVTELRKNIVNPYTQTNDMSNNMIVDGKANSAGLSTKGIQIEYEVKLIFEIK
jgi:uncharacterized protein YggE